MAPSGKLGGVETHPEGWAEVPQLPGGAEKQRSFPLTSMEQPTREDRSTAFRICLSRSGGGFCSWMLWATPPVKSSKPSMVLPPASAS